MHAAARYLATRSAWALLTALVLPRAPCFASEPGDMPFTDLKGDQCFMFSNLLSYTTDKGETIERPLEMVINDQDEYKKLFAARLRRQSCANVDMSREIAPVDFARQTVLALWSSGSCAATGFEKRVWQDDDLKRVIYRVKVIESAISCSGPGLEGLNLIAIPKVPAGYRVVFENRRG